jgi:hypothetical protein
LHGEDHHGKEDEPKAEDGQEELKDVPYTVEIGPFEGYQLQHSLQNKTSMEYN